MASKEPDTGIRITILDPQGHRLGGTVDIEFRPHGAGEVLTVKGTDASKDIDVGGLQRVPAGLYELMVTPTDVFRPVTRFVTIPASGATAVSLTIDKGGGGASGGGSGGHGAGPLKLQGKLVFDHGMPAAGLTVRLYSVDFGGSVTGLAQTRSEAGGSYSFSCTLPRGAAPNLQVRVLDAAGKEVTISATKYNAGASATVNLVVPGSAKPLGPEFERLAADMKPFGGAAILQHAVEGKDRQDLTLLNRSTNWDARLVALAASAAQHAETTGLGQKVLYALFRAGLPTDPELLAMVPSPAVRQGLAKAAQASIVSLSAQEIDVATNAFENFATKTLVASKAAGGVSKFETMLMPVFQNDVEHRDAFARLFFSQASPNSDLWTQAAKAGIPPGAIDTLRLQGKFLYLTFNNGPLAHRLQEEIESVDRLPKLAEKDYHRPETWKTAIQATAGEGDDNLAAAIPSIYTGSTAERLEAYAGDLARKVRVSFPTQVVARLVETADLAIDANTKAPVTSFLRSASAAGYCLGRTPLNTFLAKSGHELDEASTRSVKTLHRLFQITPSTESLQTALKLGFTSAYEIASYDRSEFIFKYGAEFPPGEAEMIYGQSQTISAVTFNFFALAKQLDTTPPVYSLSSAPAARQDAKNNLIQKFPSMASLFGNLDFCECEHCRSVLSPAAYFVDLLDMLGQHSAPNSAGNTPLDVLIGKSGPPSVTGRRPDLGALPLSCKNTNTQLPYIDVVNEILEYYIAHNGLDAAAASDTGAAASADLVAEPQHILPNVYTTTLQGAVYPLNLPFDLWIETVRGFSNYFKIPLARVLDAFRAADTLELFTAPAGACTRAQILSEALGISPAEYAVFTSTDTAHWFQLYGYTTQAAALADLANAKTLAQKLAVSYQELVNLVKTGFLNPSLYTLIFQFERLGIDTGRAFSFTGQPGYPALDAAHTAEFQALLDGITAQYHAKNPASTFNATTWLNTVLPANYSRNVLVLADPDTGCNFSGTTLQYADGSAAKPLDFLKLNLAVRLWKKLGWSLDETDRALQAFFPPGLPAFSDAGFGAAFSDRWKTALVYLAHLDELNTMLAPALGRIALLPLWTDLPTNGENPLYAQLFLTPSVLNNDFAFDDPNGGFPWASADLPAAQRTLEAHQPAMQGALGLTAAEVTKILPDAPVAAPAGFTLANLSICYRYSLLAQCLEIPVSDLIDLRVMSGLAPFHSLAVAPLHVLADDILLNHTLAFVQQAGVVQNSGFTVEDLRYILRHQFDPAGKYQTSPNVLIALMQSVAGGLAQIQAQNTAPPGLMSLSESLIDQRLSGLIPAAILKNLFALLGNSQTYTASAASAAPLAAADFTSARELALSYDAVTTTQTARVTGLLPDWRKAEIEALNSQPALAGLLSGLLAETQNQARAALGKSMADLLGVWASLAQYEAVMTGVAPGQSISDPLKQLTRADASLRFAYDQASQLQWLGYRGALTDAKKAALPGINPSPTLATLLNKIQQQTAAAYSELAGSLLALWTNLATYRASQSPVAAANQIDGAAFAAALAAAQEAGTITDPVPSIQFSYDAVSQTQTLTCSGVLTEALRPQLAAQIASPVLANLLQAVRNQAVQLFQSLAANLLTIAAGDLDHYAASFLGVDPARQRKTAKAELVKVFLPLLAQKLSRQLVLQTLTANLASDPSLTEALITDAALLNNPANPGESLLPAFLAVGRPGVSAAYYTSANLTGAPNTGIAATADTADPSNSLAGTASCRFEGYLQAPTDGPYRFFARLGNAGAQVAVRIDPPDPKALLANPAIQATAAADGEEASQFVQLKGGAAYHFTAEFRNLGARGASLLVQGENLPKGALSQIRLYPQAAVDSFQRAKVLLSKLLQIVQVTGMDERELAYLVAHSSQFGNLKFSGLPTQASDDSVARAQPLFEQFLTLADYADLRKGPAGGTDGLIDVFEAASQVAPPVPPAAILANLTRRDPQVVQAVATALGADPHFVNNTGIRRLWEALQIVQIVRLPVESLSASMAIVTASPTAPDSIAANFKNAVKAQYTADQWRPIAQSVFDPLRRKKRDALVAYLVNQLGFDSSNQLFEYFLVDPGMEPVVQTSRLRLAISSVQTFVQRCLLNLENGKTPAALNVEPSAIPADWWTWMKRYRVWEANRKIFLYPENWMEPELRMDKTDLFQALESALLQGDVTRDLAEDAFFAYLKGLDLRARLDIVASYLDQDLVNPGQSTLYVLGRTYGTPHKYFYRTYLTGVWSGWQTVPLDIEGDHVVLAVWRGRLNIFWLTFLLKAKAPPPSGGGSSKGVGSLTFDTLSSDILSAKPQQQLQIQLNWSEYVQGKWTPRIATDLNKAPAIDVPEDFSVRSVYVHITKEVEQGNEGAIRINVDVPTLVHVNQFRRGVILYRAERLSEPSQDYTSVVNYAFRVTSKNCDPAFGANGSAPPSMPYATSAIDATFYTGSRTLSASFESRIESEGKSTPETQPILNDVRQFELLSCSNPVAPPFLPAGDPLYWQAGGLVSPFFFKDSANPSAGLGSKFLDERTFFVQPSLTETVVSEYNGWAIAPAQPPVQVWIDPHYWEEELVLVAQVPKPPGPPDPDPVYSIFPLQDRTDLFTNPTVAVSYGGVLIGEKGSIAQGAPLVTNAGTPGGLAAAGSLVIVGSQGLALTQLGQPAGGSTTPIAAAKTVGK